MAFIFSGGTFGELTSDQKLLIQFRINMNSTTHPTQIFTYCPRCGSPGFITSGPRSKHCQACSFHYFFNASAAASALIFDQEGRLLFTRRAIDPHKGRLDFPGGFVEHNESAEEAITRELKEELGATVKKLTYFGTFPNQYEFSGMTVFTLDSTFIVELESMSGLKAMDDVAGIEFIRLQDIKPEDIPFTSMKNTITQLQKTRI